jgi:hypothetical protein
MRAVVLRGPGPAELLRVEEVADPEPAAGEVVVRLRAAALNHRDVWIRSATGAYAGGFSKPVILGSDGAGEVVAAGAGVDPALIGRAVVINPSLDWGEADAAQGPAFRILGYPDDGTYAGRGRDGPSPEGSGRPPHRSQHAPLTHWALASGPNVEALFRPRVGDPNRRKPPVDEAPELLSRVVD